MKIVTIPGPCAPPLGRDTPLDHTPRRAGRVHPANIDNYLGGTAVFGGASSSHVQLSGSAWASCWPWCCFLRRAQRGQVPSVLVLQGHAITLISRPYVSVSLHGFAGIVENLLALRRGRRMDNPIVNRLLVVADHRLLLRRDADRGLQVLPWRWMRSPCHVVGLPAPTAAPARFAGVRRLPPPLWWRTPTWPSPVRSPVGPTARENIWQGAGLEGGKTLPKAGGRVALSGTCEATFREDGLQGAGELRRRQAAVRRHGQVRVTAASAMGDRAR